MSEENKKDSVLNRRNFLGIGAAGLAAGAVTKIIQGPSRKISSIELNNQNEYEFIIVGSGAGGAPLACRLAEFGFKVLVLEAGGDKINTTVDVPILHGRSTEHNDVSWKFFVKHYENQNLAKLDTKMTPQGIFYPRASGLGGCTLHHAMITMYPDNSDFENIIKLTGDRTYHPRHMRELFKKIERNLYRKFDFRNKTQSGFNGWLSTEQTPISLAFKDPKTMGIIMSALAEEAGLDEMNEILEREGIRFKLDPNDWNYVVNKTNGIFNVPKATHGGRRRGPREYLIETKEKYPKNLTIKTHSLVNKLILSEDGKRVIGVEVTEGEHLYAADPLSLEHRIVRGTKTYMCHREVILCGGAFNSPQILMLSGIGDPTELAKNKIPLRHKLPGVGKNLQDRYEVCVVSEMNSRFNVIEDCKLSEKNDPCLNDYYKNPKSHLYGSNGVIAGLIKKSNEKLLDPDLFIFGFPANFRGYYPGWSNDTVGEKKYFTWAVLKAHTANDAGFVKLKDNSPYSTPEINFKYFDEGKKEAYKDDMQAMIEGVKIARRMNKKLGLKYFIHDEQWPGKNCDTDQEVEQFVKKEAWGHHASCSNKMGHANDPLAVVDSKFKVHGMQGLRIVDASVFPKIPGMFIVLPIYMMSEKAAESIIEEYSVYEF